jgi:Uma2 family endonuclease
MSTRTLISVEEYLASSYEPDCDYVDGEVVERNVGEWDHSDLQLAIGSYLRQRQKKCGIRVVTEQRVQVKPGRFRVPDVCVVLGEPGEQILTKPPFICIEILSRDDRLSRLEERIDDYLAMGVPYVWVLDPGTRRAYTATAAEGLREVKSGVLKTAPPLLEVPLDEIFS